MKTLLTTLVIMLCMLATPNLVRADACSDAKDAMAAGAIGQTQVDNACGVKKPAAPATSGVKAPKAEKATVVTLTAMDVIIICLGVLGSLALLIIFILIWLKFRSLPVKVDKRIRALITVLHQNSTLDDAAIKEIARLVDEQ